MDPTPPEGTTSPRAYISHASEDKERFVIPFATALRANGIDAWVDRWEMHPGDSLVQRIFDEGIGESAAFIVVLSHISVTKPWVREELDAGVVRRINSDRAKRLIPVVLDAEVQVPAALQHLLWLSVSDLGLDGVVKAVSDTLHGREVKPALGAPPAYLRQTPTWTAESADETVFRLIVDEWRAHGPNTILFSDDAQAAAREAGIGEDRFHESMHVLVSQGLVRARAMAGGQRWWFDPFPDSIWLDLETEAGVDIQALRGRLLADVVNRHQTNFDPANLEAHGFTVRGVLHQMASEGLFTVHDLADTTFVISNVSPLATRALRESGRTDQ